MTTYAIATTDGGVVIMTTTGDHDPVSEVAKWPAELQAMVDTGSIQEVAAATVSRDRTFRKAWKRNLSVDMPKARQIWRARMRVARTPLLVQLDQDYMRADEQGDAAAKQRIAAHKQVLRDVTADPALEAAATPKQLQAVWPAVLGPPP